MIELPQQASVADLQRYVHELEASKGWLEADLARNCFLMGEEVGELFAAVRKLEPLLHPDPEAPGRREAVEHVGEELVDVMNYLLAIANRLDLDLEACFRAKNARNQHRTWD